MATKIRTCPNQPQHEDGPAGYVAWHNWAARIARTHTQSRCSDCGLFAIWTKRVVR